MIQEAIPTPQVVPSPEIARVTVGPYGQAVDALEVEMMKHPGVELPLVHRFTPGLYTREIHMPAGALIVSKIHRTEHQFIVSRGRLAVMTDLGEWEEIVAPYHGITRPGTRRVLYIIEDTVWTTFHATDKTDPESVERDIIEPHSEHRAGLVQPAPLPAWALAEQGG